MSLDQDGYEIIWSPDKINTSHRALIRKGFSNKEAGNLIAIFMGLEPTTKGWTPKELKLLIFLKYLNDNKNIEFTPAYSTMD